MTTNPLGRHYDKLTPAERLPLILAAAGRGDEGERCRLVETAERGALTVPDYYRLADALDRLATLHLLRLLELAAEFMARLGAPDHDPAGFDRLLYLGYLLNVHAAGWAAYCAERAVAPDALTRDLPGFDAAAVALRVAAEASFTEEGAAAYLRRTPGDGPAVPTVAGVCTTYRQAAEALEGGRG